MFNTKFLLITAAALVATHAAAAEPVAPAAAVPVAAAAPAATAATAAAAAPAAAAADATKVAAVAPPKKPKIICITSPETGSLVKARKECGTAAEWKERQQGARQQAIEMQTSRLETAQ